MAQRIQLSVDQLASMLSDAGQRHGPLHRHISATIAKRIRDGDIPTYAYLPSERAMATRLGVSRSTIVTAYDSLREQGWTHSLRGSGFFVSPAAPGAHHRPPINQGLLASEHPSGRFEVERLARVDLSSAAPSAVPQVEASLLSVTDVLHDVAITAGYFPRGLPAFRERIARYHDDLGLPTHPDSVFVTSGIQPAIELLISACLKPGDRVLMEDPTYRGAIHAFRGRGLLVQEMPRGPHGLEIEELKRLIDSDLRPRLIYLMSSIHSPTGASMSPAYKRRIVEMTASHGIIVIDDAALAELAFDTAEARPLAYFGDADNIFTINSMSKLFWGGLRVGWIRASSSTTALLARLQGRVDLGASVVSQLISMHLLDDAPSARAIRRQQLESGLRLLTEALAQSLPSWTWDIPAGGTSLWVKLPLPCATLLSEAALAQGLAIAPGPQFSVASGQSSHIRLPLTASSDLLLEGVSILTGVWRGVDHAAP